MINKSLFQEKILAIYIDRPTFLTYQLSNKREKLKKKKKRKKNINCDQYSFSKVMNAFALLIKLNN